MENIIANLTLFAQEATGTPAPGAEQMPAGGGMTTLLIYGLLFVGLWFLLFLPQRKQRKAQQKMQSELKVGDTVIAAGGIYGKIVSLEEHKATLEIAQGRITVIRSQIAAKAE